MAEKRRLREIGKTILIIILGVSLCIQVNTKRKEYIAKDAKIDSFQKADIKNMEYMTIDKRIIIKLVKDTTYSHQKIRDYEKRTLKSR